MYSGSVATKPPLTISLDAASTNDKCDKLRERESGRTPALNTSDARVKRGEKKKLLRSNKNVSIADTDNPSSLCRKTTEGTAMAQSNG